MLGGHPSLLLLWGKGLSSELPVLKITWGKIQQFINSSLASDSGGPP